jgi:hypothetical protein
VDATARGPTLAVDLAEINHTPMVRAVTARSPDDHQAVVATLKARIETLEVELAKLEASTAVHRADFEPHAKAQVAAVETAVMSM